MARDRLGESLRTARARARWTREALAYYSGVSWSAIAQIESGRRRDVRLSTLFALADALEVSVDYLIGTTAAISPSLFEHRVLAYGNDEEYLEAAVPFLVDGIELSHCLLAVTTGSKNALLRDALGERAEHVEFTDWADWYPSPKEALRRYRAFVEQKFDAGAVWIRIVAEAGWSGRSAFDIATWTRYESLINLAFATAPATIMCTYDVRLFPVDVVAEACCTHPHVADGSGVSASLTYRKPEDFLLEPQDALG